MPDPLFRFASLLRHVAQAKTHYYVHSPFVYTLLTETLYSPVPTATVAALKRFRERQRTDMRVLEITPVGTSTYQKQERVGDLSRRCALPMRYGKFLFKVIERFKPTVILETGTGTGFSTACLALANPASYVHTVDARRPLLDLAADTLIAQNIDNVTYHQGDLDVVLASVCKTVAPIDAAYLDANHTHEATIRYFNTLLPHLTTKAFVVVDDIHWSRGMNRAWNELCRHPAVTLSLDFFRLGVLFLDPGLSRQTIALYY